MLSERAILISLLKLTKEGPVEIEEISREAHIPVQLAYNALKESSDLGIVRLEGELVLADGEQRLRAAIRAVGLGTDIERVCKFLTWTEFEDISILAFEANGFTVGKHFRFSRSGRRWEIDILALKRPFVASVDCKQWRKGWRGAASRTAAERQTERTEILAKASATMDAKIGIKGWEHADFVPIVLSLLPGARKFHRGTPVVPVLQLTDFLREMPAYINKIKHFHVDLAKTSKLLSQFHEEPN